MRKKLGVYLLSLTMLFMGIDYTVLVSEAAEIEMQSEEEADTQSPDEADADKTGEVDAQPSDEADTDKTGEANTDKTDETDTQSPDEAGTDKTGEVDTQSPDEADTDKTGETEAQIAEDGAEEINETETQDLAETAENMVLEANPTKAEGEGAAAAVDVESEKAKRLYELLEDGIKNTIGIDEKTYIDISALKLSDKDGSEDRELLSAVFKRVIYDHLEYFYVTGGYARYSNANGLLKGVRPVYYDFAKKPGAIDKFNDAVELALSQVDGVSDPLEQVLILHDYLVTNSVYNYDVAADNSDLAPPEVWSAYGALVSKDTVCMGYSLAYRLLLERLGIKCLVVASREMNHDWNMVQLDGEWYHVDVNRANSIHPTLRGRCRHDIFLVSDDTLSKNGYYNWTVYGYTGWDEPAPICSSKKYETGEWAFNNKTDYPMYRDSNGKYYYIRRINSRTCKLYYGLLAENGTELAVVPLYTLIEPDAYYTQSGIVWLNHCLYYVNLDKILMRYDLLTGQETALLEIPFTAQPSPDGKFEYYNDGIGLVHDTVNNTIEALSRTRRQVLAKYKIGSETWKEKLPKPTADVETTDKVEKGTKVALACAVDGADIYYTVDMTEPTRESILYDGPVIINRTTTIKAFAVKEDYQDSETAVFSYTVNDAEEGTEEDSKEDSEESGFVPPEDMPEDGKIPDGLWIAPFQDNIYTGKAIMPQPHIYDGNVKLKVGKDCTVSYKNNIKAAQATDPQAPSIIVKGRGDYSGSVTKTFSILKKDIGDADVIKTFTDAYAVTGNAKNPVLLFDAAYRNKPLKKNRDYTLTVKDSTQKEVATYVDEGTYIMTVKGIGTNFTGEYDLSFEVQNKVPVSRLKIDKISDIEYDGKEKTPDPKVKYGKIALIRDQDYRLTYRNNIEAGTATVTIAGIGEYFGTRNISFTITGRNISDVKFTGFKNTAVYTGDAIYQDNAVLTYNGNKLAVNKDYTVKYSNNLNAGKAVAEYTGKGIYTGTLKKTYQINAFMMSVNTDNRIHFADEEIETVYTKGGSRPHVALYDGNRLLEEGKDYTLSYTHNTAVTTSRTRTMPTATAKGKGNYRGILKQKKEFSITKGDLGQVSISASDVALNNKKSGYKSVPVLIDINGKTLKAGKDYNKNYGYTYKSRTVVKHMGEDIVREAGDRVDKDDIVPVNTVLCVCVSAGNNSNYAGTSRTAEYRIVKVSINKAKITVKNSFIYTGREIKIDKSSLVIKVGKDTLTEEQYEILENTYKNNINKGTASVQIRGKGTYYGGTATVYFKIGTKEFSQKGVVQSDNGKG